MKKNYVLDTNVLIHDPYCIFKFDDNNIYIPHPVIEELDKFKNEKNERGYNSRQAIRNINLIRKKGDIAKGIKNEHGGQTKILFYENLKYDQLPSGFKKDTMDNIILLCVKELQAHHPHVILVTNDSNMQLKSDILGIPVQEYKNDRVASETELYKGSDKIELDNEVISQIYKNGSYELNEEEKNVLFGNAIENEFFVAKSPTGSSALIKYHNGTLSNLERYKTLPMDIQPRNANQRFLIESLMTPCEEIPLTICNGPAGTGKTLLAISAGLEQVMEKKMYRKVLFTRANIMMDEEIGFLPGSEFDKISPLLRGLRDNLEIIFAKKDDTPEEVDDKINELFQRQYICAESMGYLRGRSIPNTFIIIDEAQNCTPRQMLSILTRVGKNSKIVAIGDIKQVDNTRLDSRNNGLIYTLENMKGSPLCDIITFDEEDCERSPLSKDASCRLKI